MLGVLAVSSLPHLRGQPTFEVLFEFKSGVEELFKGNSCCQTARAAGLFYKWPVFGSGEASGELGVSSFWDGSQL